MVAYGVILRLGLFECIIDSNTTQKSYWQYNRKKGVSYQYLISLVLYYSCDCTKLTSLLGLEITKEYVFTISVPATGPEHLMSCNKTTVSSMISWEPPHCQHRNGDINKYVVCGTLYLLCTTLQNIYLCTAPKS